MKLSAVVVLIVIILFAANEYVFAVSSDRCRTGQVRGYAHVRGDPRIGIGSLPSTFTRQQDQFAVRYNCSARPVEARRISEGVYEVRFPNNPAKTAAVTAVNSQGASAAIYYKGDGKFVVTIRGPIVNNNILEPRELPFYIIVV